MNLEKIRDLEDESPDSSRIPINRNLSIAALESVVSMSEDEFVEWCDEDFRAEYVDGKVIIMIPESVRGERMRWTIGTILGLFVEHHDLGEVFSITTVFC